MPWDGNGTFDRVHNFSADASAGIQAQAARFDAEFDGIKTGLENCVTLTGETSPTADSPMGGFKHTGVAAATSTDNYLRADQNSNQVGIFVRDVNTGVTGKISAAAAVFPTAFTDGQRVTVKVSADGSTSAPRWIVINGLSANIIDNDGSAIPASKMRQDGIFDLIYDADVSAFRSITPNNEAEGGTFSVVWKGFVNNALSASCEYHKHGNTVIFTVNTTIQSSSSASNYETTTSVVPAAIVPATTKQFPARVTDAGTETWGIFQIGSNGKLSFFADAAQSGFTTSGLRGNRADMPFTYYIEDA